jgi:hypothetical protein
MKRFINSRKRRQKTFKKKPKITIGNHVALRLKCEIKSFIAIGAFKFTTFSKYAMLHLMDFFNLIMWHTLRATKKGNKFIQRNKIALSLVETPYMVYQLSSVNPILTFMYSRTWHWATISRNLIL